MILKLSVQVQPRFYDTVDKCFWMGKDFSKNIDSLFTPVITNEGICYSFNLLDRSEMFTETVDNDFYENFLIPHVPPTKWSIEKGYQADSDLRSFPYRSVMSGLQGGLELTLLVNSSNLDYFCGDTLQGYKIILHNPLQLPYAKQRHFFVGLNQDVLIAVKPNMITTSKSLVGYSPLHRKCFFTYEKELRFFKVYDQKNCLQECLSNFTYNHCNCVAFYMLHDNSTPICGPRMDDCIKEAVSLFLVNDIKIKMEYQQDKNKRNLKNYISTEKCDCLPTCNSLTFEAEVSQTDWSWKEAANILSDKARELSKTTHWSRLQIFFKDMQFITSERNELYGNMDFLASCGGLLGLFIGFSFISIVEILYYISLRLFCNFLNGRRRNVKESDSV
ncbi:hypothetical protein ILUMI_13195 [Ignelater luminosus]|uniref:Uncharacterized protein n=1 Tax=Ignelater luminosus TaxID=2038154 RepID=A0A8K0GC79_IGNLU|nr:hypothetical protein ILUMI_13195 [Ignelater luminosus]